MTQSLTEKEINTIGTVSMSQKTAFMALSTPLGVTIGHAVLPQIGLAYLSAGGGSLSVAATSVLASGGILVLPAIAMYLLIDSGVTNSFLNSFLKTLVLAGYMAGTYLLAAELFDVNSLALFCQSLGGSLTIGVFSIGLILALAILAFGVAACVASCRGGQKGRDRIGDPGLFAYPSATASHQTVPVADATLVSLGS